MDRLESIAQTMICLCTTLKNSSYMDGKMNPWVNGCNVTHNLLTPRQMAKGFK